MVKGAHIPSVNVNPRHFVNEMKRENPRCFVVMDEGCFLLVSDISDVQSRLGYCSGVYSNDTLLEVADMEIEKGFYRWGY